MPAPIDLFTYGVLMYSELLHALTGKTYVSVSATLHGFQRYSLEKEPWPRVPVVVAEIGSSVRGVLVRDVDEHSMELLDDFEEVDIGLYVKANVGVVDGQGQEGRATAYIAGPEVVDCLSGVWDPEQFVQQHYVEYRDRIIPRFLRER